MSKYDTCKQLIESTLSKEELVDNGEGILSVYSLCQLVNNRFKDFGESFDRDKAYKLIEEAMDKIKLKDEFYISSINLHPSFSDDQYKLILSFFSNYRKSRCRDYEEKKIIISEEKGSNEYYYKAPYHKDNFIPYLDDYIKSLFLKMKEYETYGMYLSWDEESGYTDITSSYCYNGFLETINFFAKQKCYSTRNGLSQLINCSYSLDLNEVDEDYIISTWSDGRKPLSELFYCNEEALAKRIPIDINNLDKSDLFKKIYCESNNISVPKRLQRKK